MNFENALFNPICIFNYPGEVCEEQQLTVNQKIQILHSWEYDALQLQIAEEENMGGGSPDVMDDINAALHKLHKLS